MISGSFVFGQTDTSLMKSETYTALKFRNIGPALTSGRIADIVIHPDNQNIMYVGVGSGGVWKTDNAGTTWTPIFDNEASYSIGCITLDPNDANIIWVGTGENVGGRHVGFGDGVYRSMDGGASWVNMGLKDSEHISKIIVHPDNSDVIYVAAQGPLWSKGGERGLYKSTDGGATWMKTLGDDEWTGVTDMLIDPTDPMILYAATWQRHRTVAAYLGGGPGSGIHKSIDGGETWTKLSKGLPTSNLGKIGMTLSPFDTHQIYAAVETDRKTGGLYMSIDGGQSWVRQSDMVSGGTGPHYYQELYADPHKEGRLYLMNNVVFISEDHGKTYKPMNEDKKHVDSHAIAWRHNDPNYLIVGTDGGLYESFDRTKTWRHFGNLPVTQYYKVAVDDAEPFYNIYGGTQDNGSHGGPSRTMSDGGIQNRDWRIVLGADGHQSATEPGNPNITYGEFQEGWLFRIDHTTGEPVFIQPQPAAGDPHERFNWDAPILVSPHDPTRLYFASYRVWRSDNRGDDWTAVSGDLTRNQERITLPIMGGGQSWDNAWDVVAMSQYNTITSLAESPIQEGLLYAGTDDGIIQSSEDGGSSWKKLEVKNINGVPSTAFVNDIRADLYDANVVYACLDNHKYGDFKPYFIKSADRGRTWKMMTNDLPSKLLVWRMVQDHVSPDLMFLATEFGIYFTTNGGANWVQMKGGLPTISFRDITIQRRENDVVAASFGRGFYVLDDYSALRDIASQGETAPEAVLYSTRPAYWYAQHEDIYGQGHSNYAAENPAYGATFTYYLKDAYTSMSSERTKKESELTKAKRSIPFPGWEALEAERLEDKPTVYLTIKDKTGTVIQTITGSTDKGINRVTWDLGVKTKDLIKLDPPKGEGDWFAGGSFQATPGTYTVTLSKEINGEIMDLSGPQEFEVLRLKEGTLKSADYAAIDAFRERFESFKLSMTQSNMQISKSKKLLSAMNTAYNRADRQSPALLKEMHDLSIRLDAIDTKFNGNKTKAEIGESNPPSPGDGLFIGYMALGGTYGPTANHLKAFDRAEDQLSQYNAELISIVNDIIDVKSKLSSIGAPPIEE